MVVLLVLFIPFVAGSVVSHTCFSIALLVRIASAGRTCMYTLAAAAAAQGLAARLIYPAQQLVLPSLHRRGEAGCQDRPARVKGRQRPSHKAADCCLAPCVCW